MASVYERLRQHLEQFPVPTLPGEGILEFLRLILTEEEAEMLTHFKSYLNFVTIQEFTKFSRFPEETVKRVFHELGRRNLIRFELRDGIEHYAPHGFVIGLFEAFFSTWQKQDPEILVPAAQSVEKYFNSVFHHEASGSKSPWARVIPHIQGIDDLQTRHPEWFSRGEADGGSFTSNVKRSTELIDYGIKEARKRLETQGISGVVDMARNDGGAILDSLAKSVTSFFGFGKKKAPRSPRTRAVQEKNLLEKKEKTIHLDASIPVSLEIHPYEVIREYIQQASSIVVADCSCRKKNKLLDTIRPENDRINCKAPLETCFQLRYDGSRAHPYNMMGGREVSAEEALQILDRCERRGLVHTTFNSKEKIEFICNCCPDCCGILSTLTRFQHHPAAFVESNFHPFLSRPEDCTSCGLCAQKCPTGAIIRPPEKGDLPSILLENCIGCGVCASICPNDVIQLRKVKSREPALDAIEAYIRFTNQRRG